MGWLENWVQRLLKNVSKTVRNFTAFVFIVLAVGVFIGVRAAESGDPTHLLAAYAAPLLFAVLSYLSTEIAVFFFVLFAILIFLL